MKCLECNELLSGKQSKFCSIRHNERYNHRKAYKHKIDKESFCIKCGTQLTHRQYKFCSKKCNANFNYIKYGRHDYHRKLRSANPRSYLSRLRSVKDRAENISLDFLVNIYEKQEGLCAVSKVPLTHEQPGGNVKVPTNISIDKIDPSKGYTEDNVRLVCHRINIMKFDGSDVDLIDWCKKVLDAHKKDPHS